MFRKLYTLLFLVAILKLGNSQVYSIHAQKEDILAPSNYAHRYQYYVPTEEAFNRYKRQVFSSWFLSRPPVTMAGQTYQNSGGVVPSLTDLISVALQSINGNQQGSYGYGSYPQSTVPYQSSGPIQSNGPFQDPGSQSPGPFQGSSSLNYAQNPMIGPGNFIPNTGSYGTPQGSNPGYQNGYAGYQNGPLGPSSSQNGPSYSGSSNMILAGPGVYPGPQNSPPTGQYGLIPSLGGAVNSQFSAPYANGPTLQFSAAGQLGATTPAPGPTGPFGGFFQRLIGGGRSIGTSRDANGSNGVGRSLGTSTNNNSSTRSKRSIKTLKVPDKERPGMKNIIIQLYEKKN